MGEAHEGSLRAPKMLKEQSNEAFEHTRIRPAVVDLGDEQQLKGGKTWNKAVYTAYVAPSRPKKKLVTD